LFLIIQGNINQVAGTLHDKSNWRKVVSG
jgi:hypothetical protein